MTMVLDFLTSPAAAIALVMAASVFMLIFAVGLAATSGAERIARIRSAAHRGQAAAPSRKRGGTPGGEGIMAMIRHVAQRFNVMKERQSMAVQHKLAQAGWRSRDAMTLYMFGKLALPLVFAAVTAAMLFAINDFGQPLLFRVAGVLGAGLLGSHLPELLVKNQIQKRAESIRGALPDALDLMVICAEAGLSLDASVKRVSREIAPASAELAEEMSITLLELRFLPDRRQALENLAARVDLSGVQALVNTLFQTEKFGTPLAQALRVLSQEMRNERMMRAEEKAARLPAIMTIPLIVFILPALFMVLMGPAMLDVLDAMSG